MNSDTVCNSCNEVQITKYKAKDGKVFDTREDCTSHNEYLAKPKVYILTQTSYAINGISELKILGIYIDKKETDRICETLSKQPRNSSMGYRIYAAEEYIINTDSYKETTHQKITNTPKPKPSKFWELFW